MRKRGHRTVRCLTLEHCWRGDNSIAIISIAIISLVASAFVPMAYCRFGCPTGALLNSLSGIGGTFWSGRDTVTAILLLAALIVSFV